MEDIPFSPPWQLAGTEGNGSTQADLISLNLGVRKIPIVVADDDSVSRILTSSLIEEWGFQAVVTQTGHEAMEALRAQSRPCLAILDWMMPGMDGIEVCRRIREGERIVYIIMVTARGGKQNLVEGLLAGADDYLVKPFDKTELHARIRVGVRILHLYAELNKRVTQLEEALAENRDLKLRLPL